MVVGEKHVEMTFIGNADRGVAEGNDAGTGIENQDVLAEAQFHTRRVAADLHVRRERCRVGAAHTPEPEVIFWHSCPRCC